MFQFQNLGQKTNCWRESFAYPIHNNEFLTFFFVLLEWHHHRQLSHCVRWLQSFRQHERAWSGNWCCPWIYIPGIVIILDIPAVILVLKSVTFLESTSCFSVRIIFCSTFICNGDADITFPKQLHLQVLLILPLQPLLDVLLLIIPFASGNKLSPL